MIRKKTETATFYGRFVGSYVRPGGSRNGNFVPDREIMQIEVGSRGRLYLLESEPVTIGSILYQLGDVVEFNVKVVSYGAPRLIPVNVRKSDRSAAPEINDIDICDVYAGCISAEEGKSSVHQVYFTQANGSKILVRTFVPADFSLLLKPYDKCLYEFSLTSSQGQTSVYARCLRGENDSKARIYGIDLSDDSDFAGSESSEEE